MVTVRLLLSWASSNEVATVVQVDRRDEHLVELTRAGAGHRDRDVSGRPPGTHHVEAGARIDRGLEGNDVRRKLVLPSAPMYSLAAQKVVPSVGSTSTVL
jgi:hypothetical protein